MTIIIFLIVVAGIFAIAIALDKKDQKERDIKKRIAEEEERKTREAWETWQKIQKEKEAKLEAQRRLEEDVRIAKEKLEAEEEAKRKAEEEAKRIEEHEKWSKAYKELEQEKINIINIFFKTTDIKFVTMNESNMVFSFNNEKMIMIGFDKEYYITDLYNETYDIHMKVSIKAMDLFYHSHI